jgi:hypothetical protein
MLQELSRFPGCCDRPSPAMRMLITDAIESLILLLDEIDGDAENEQDADFEDEPDEPDADLEPRFVPVFEAG